MKTIVTALLLSLFAGACGTAEKRPSEMEAGMAAWVGKTYSEYTAARGAPKLTIVETDGAKTLEYVKERILHRHATSTVVMMPVSIANGAAVMVPHTVLEPPVVLTFTCKLVVKFSSKDILESWKVGGNDC
jgi:hypothetical protein